jgi:hypothetical protein
VSASAGEQGPFRLSQVLAEEYERLHGSRVDFPPEMSEPERLKAIYRRIHALPHGRAALCLSGGGIRSATFGLGVIQGLARVNLLDKFDYLSTVSGGGYIGSWLTAWIKHHPRGLAGVTQELSVLARAPLEPEPDPVNWIRRYSNYLSPRLGLLSADSWTVIGIYLRNLLLNWLVLLPLALAGLAIPRLYLALARLAIPDWMPEWALLMVVAVGGLLIVLSLTYIHLYRPSLAYLRTHERWKTFEEQPWFLLCSWLPLLTASLLLMLVWAWFHNTGKDLGAVSWYGWAIRRTLILFTVATSAINVAAWVIACFCLDRFRKGQEPLLAELAVIVMSGALGGLLAWTGLEGLTHEQRVGGYAAWYATFAAPGFLGGFLLAATFFVGIASLYTRDEDREWWGRSGAWVLIGGVAWMAASGIAIFGPIGLVEFPTLLTSLGGLSGLIGVVLGFSRKTAALNSRESEAGLVDPALAVAAPVAVVFALALLAAATSQLFALMPDLMLAGSPEAGRWTHQQILEQTRWDRLVVFIATMALIGVVLSRYININKFSLHSMYRNRLIRAYLGASRLAVYGQPRNPNRFTGFDPKDNFEMKALAPDGTPVQKPFHVVNIALNLVRGTNLAWQQRKAVSFTVSPLHCGSFLHKDLGYRRSTEYGKNHAYHTAITLGTALAISGAAASPNMGYHSSPAVAFLLTLFNVRLGWWLGNPGTAGDKTFDRSCPDSSIRPLLAEAFGLTDECNPYVYLSDGGHFENLGLYEMVLRRCHLILVSDAGCDPRFVFQDLGNAIRKIRVDLGIDIDINLDMLRRQDQDRRSRWHHAIGTIRYTNVDDWGQDGVLVYLKPSLTGNEPVDVLEYAAQHEAFPHETTADQFFDESQFESYRRLGQHIVEKVFGQVNVQPGDRLGPVFARLRSDWNV